MGRRLALITGASSGIGRALSIKLAAYGYDVLLWGRDARALEETAAQCRKAGAQAKTSARDLALPLKDLSFEAAPDLLVNNAGSGVHGPFVDTPLAEELKLLHVQTDAVLALTKAVLPGMVARGSGTILNVGSVYSFTPVPDQAVYGASKAFLRSFTDALAGELEGTGVRVLGIYPGITRTNFRERAGIQTGGKLSGKTAEEIADAAYEAIEAGAVCSIPGFSNKVFVTLTSIVCGHRMAGLVKRINRLRGLGSAPER